MFMVVPGWDVFANLAEDDNRNLALFVRLHVSDADLEAVVRTLRSNGYVKLELERDKFGGSELGFQQTVED